MSTNNTSNIISDIAARLGRLVIPDAEAEARRQRAENGERSIRALELWARSEVPRRHADRALHPSSPAPASGWTQTRARVLGMLGRGVTVCLTGTRGNGKTQIGVEAILATTLKGNSGLFRTVQRMFMEFKGTFDDGPKRTELQVLESLRRPSLLVLDEIGQRKESEWENRTFFEVLNARYNVSGRQTGYNPMVLRSAGTRRMLAKPVLQSTNANPVVSGQIPLRCLASPVPGHDRCNLFLGVTTSPRRCRNRGVHVGDSTPPNVRPSDAVPVTDTKFTPGEWAKAKRLAVR